MVDDGFWKQQGWMFSKDIWWPLTGSHSIQVNRDSSWTFYGSHRKPHNPDWLYQISLKIVLRLPQYPMEPLILQTSSLHPGLVCNLHIIIIIIMVIIIITIIIIIINLSSLGGIFVYMFCPCISICLSLSDQAITKDLWEIACKDPKIVQISQVGQHFQPGL